ncbi:DUF805 domain-containing protein [Oxalobacter sp. OttesenSCG-928-P03]|nr:DUF805 domain-containing protein [Oxalobacter sp. OttesenSCG-928-P03]
MMNIRHTAEYNLWDHYLLALTSWGGFGGRATRNEFFGYHLFSLLFYLAWHTLCRLFGGIHADILTGLYLPVFLLPAIPLYFRRLHDTGRSGWHLLPAWLLLGFAILFKAGICTPYDACIPAVYILSFLSAVACLALLFILFLSPSAPGKNIYGPNPWRVFHQRRPERMQIVEI